MSYDLFETAPNISEAFVEALEATEPLDVAVSTPSNTMPRLPATPENADRIGLRVLAS